MFNPLRPFDLSAQTTGVPTTHRTTSHEDDIADAVAAGEAEAAGLTPHPTHVAPDAGATPQPQSTRATSLTEPGDSGDAEDGAEKGSPSSKPATTAPATAAASDNGDSDAGGPSANAEEDEDAIELERRASLVQSLAKQYTAQSHAHAVNPFGGDLAEDSPLNPNGPNFSALAWAKAVVAMVSSLQPQSECGESPAASGGPFRTAGVAFQHMSVHGFGSATDYQKDVGNVLLAVGGWVRSMAGRLGLVRDGRGQRIDILRDFNGIVRNGEMLVVLGPPGSGCSTFLKTIAGETAGLWVGEESYFNYQGELTEFYLNPCLVSYFAFSVDWLLSFSMLAG